MLNAITLYRLAHLLWRWKIPLVPKAIKLMIFFLYNSSVPYECEIGEGSFLAYGGIGVILHRRARIGRNVNIGSNVVVGGRSGSKEVPVIGDNVFLATGCKILGNVEIGNHVVVGANAVVTASVPPLTVVAGIPAKVVRSLASEEEYRALI